MSIRLIIADDQRLFRQSLRIVLEHESDVKVIGEASDGQEAYELAKALRPDTVLMDVEMPKLDGIAATKILVKRERVDPVVTPQRSDNMQVKEDISEEELNSEIELIESDDVLRQIEAAVAPPG